MTCAGGGAMKNVHGSLIGVGTIPSVGKVHKGVPISGLYFVMFSPLAASSFEFLGSAKRVPQNNKFCLLSQNMCYITHTHIYICAYM